MNNNNFEFGHFMKNQLPERRNDRDNKPKMV
jgi:hypothetical protein